MIEASNIRQKAMTFEEDVFHYLNGGKFSNGLDVHYKSGNYNLGRLEFLERHLSGKKVIHVGCADHIPLIKQKMSNSTWLHGRLEAATEALVGLDINSEAIDYLKSLGVTNVYCTDLIENTVTDIIQKEYWDYMILGEIVEHLDNPVEFLSKVNNKYCKYVEKILITVPNAFRLTNFIKALGSTELINTDHKFWFTPYTLAKVINQSGMIASEFYIVHAFFSRNPFKRLLGRWFPLLNDTLIMAARFKQ